MSIGVDHIGVPSSEAVTSGAQPNPSWKTRRPSRLAGWFTLISSTSGGPTVSVEEADAGDEVDRQPVAPVAVVEVEELDPHPGVRAPEVAAGADLAGIVDARVDPRLALRDDGTAGEPRPLPHDHADEQEEERAVEQETPHLTEHALLRGHGAALPGDPEPLPPQVAGGAGGGLVGGGSHPELRVVEEPVQLARMDRPLPQGAEEGARPREQTRGERDEQQGRDQHEPPGPVHVEEAGAEEEGPPRAVVVEIPSHPLGRVRDLGKERPDHRGRGEDQEEDQRRAHRAQVAPDEGDRLANRGAGRGRHRAPMLGSPSAPVHGTRATTRARTARAGRRTA